MTDKCASPDLYDRFTDIRWPVSRDILYHEYGITDYTTEYSDSRPFYYLSSDHWLEPVPGGLFGDTLYDSSNDKYFIKGCVNSRYLYNGLSSWFTINQLALALHRKPKPLPLYNPIPMNGVSPTNKLSERQIYRVDNNQPVEAIQYDRDPSGTIYYYIHHDYIDAAHNKWHTESELLQLGYSFTQNHFGLVYNIGLNATSHTNIV